MVHRDLDDHGDGDEQAQGAQRVRPAVVMGARPEDHAADAEAEPRQERVDEKQDAGAADDALTGRQLADVHPVSLPPNERSERSGIR